MFCRSDFDGDISKWDVSRVTDMNNMFTFATFFNGNLSQWDVSRAKDMNSMFTGTKFNGDISKWDASRVTNMDSMFENAGLFNQELCGAAWVYSRASKKDMFERSSGSIAQNMCSSPSQRWLARWKKTSTSTTASLTISGVTSVSARMVICSKCAIFKKSGRVSCCAPGGAWYHNCGDGGDSNTGYSWFEGVRACKPTTTTPISLSC